MTISAASGSVFSLGTTALAANLTAFQADTYTDVGQIEDLGEFGDQAEEITFASLSDGRMQKLKGVRDAGTMTVVVGSDDADAGQTAMLAAEADTLDYNVRVTLNDKITSGGTPSVHYFHAKVMSRRTTVGTANNVVKRTFNVGINSAITSVAAT